MPTKQYDVNVKIVLASRSGPGLLLVVAGAGGRRHAAQGLHGAGDAGAGDAGAGTAGAGDAGAGLAGARVCRRRGCRRRACKRRGCRRRGCRRRGCRRRACRRRAWRVMGTDLSPRSSRASRSRSVEIRGTTPTSPSRGARAHQRPGHQHRRGQLHLGRGRIGGRALRGRAPASTRRAIRPRISICTSPASRRIRCPNLFHRGDAQDNEDELYVVYLLPQVERAVAVAVPVQPRHRQRVGDGDPGGSVGDPNKFIFACTATGVASKCARNWGYRPWATTQAWVYDDDDRRAGAGRPLRARGRTTTRASRRRAAAYCQDGKSYTKNGTLVDLFDTRQIIWPNAIENPFNAPNPIRGG